MRAIELGRAARAAAKVKMRQPLRKAVIVATAAERGELERLSDIVASELNVKELEFVSEEAELVTYAVKPNYRTLGPRFGKLMPQAAAAVAALDPGHAAEAIRGERRIGVNVDGSEHTLEADDMTLVMQPLDGYEVEAEAGRAVALARRLNQEAGDTPLGIIPFNPRGLERRPSTWPGYPWKDLAAEADAFAPMIYTGGAYKGFDATYGYVTRALRLLRVQTGDSDVSIHVAGGVADRLGPDELAGFSAAVEDDGSTTLVLASTTPYSRRHQQELTDEGLRLLGLHAADVDTDRLAVRFPPPG